METSSRAAVDQSLLKPKKVRSLQSGETLSGWLFVSPMLIGVFILVLLPILATIVLSFADWNFVQGWNGINWVGFGNFKKLLHDTQFLRSVRNNFLFLFSVPLYMIISMALAVIIDRHVYLKGYFKVAYFMPYISNIVAVAVVWQVLFQPSYGPINQIPENIRHRQSADVDRRSEICADFNYDDRRLDVNRLQHDHLYCRSSIDSEGSVRSG